MKHAPALLAFTVAAPCGFLLTAGLRPSGDARRDVSSAAAAPRSVLGGGEPGVATAAAAALPPTPSPAVLRTAADVERLFDGEAYLKAQAELWEALQTMDAAAVAALAGDLARAPDSSTRSALFTEAVWERWVRLDPEAVASFWPLIDRPMAGINAFRSLARHFSRTDPDRLERLIRRGDASVQSSAKQELLRSLAETDPAKAAENLSRPFYSGLNKMMASEIAMKWAVRDAESALAWARRLSADQGRDQALTSLLRTRIEKDPAMGARMLSSAPPEQRPALCAALAEGWTPVDERAVLTWLSDLKDPAELRQAREGYLRAKLRGGGGEAAVFLRSVPEGWERETLRYRVLETMGYFSSGGAVELLCDAPPGADLEPGVAEKIAQRIPHPPEQTRTVLSWALGLERNDTAAAAAGVILSRTEEKSLPELLPLIDAQENLERRAALREKLAQRWAFLNLSAAEAWMRTLPVEDQPAVIKQMLQWAKPQKAAPLLHGVLNATPAAPDDPAWTQPTVRLFSVWACDDAPAAAAAVVDLPPGENRQAALRAVEHRWFESDVKACAAWRETLSPGDRALLPERG